MYNRARLRHGGEGGEEGHSMVIEWSVLARMEKSLSWMVTATITQLMVAILNIFTRIIDAAWCSQLPEVLYPPRFRHQVLRQHQKQVVQYRYLHAASLMKCWIVGILKTLLIGLVFILIPRLAFAQTTIFDCLSGWSATTSASCGVSTIGYSSPYFAISGSPNGSTPSVGGGVVTLVPANATHNALSLNYQTLVNIQAFNATFTFVPNGGNVSFILNNSNNGSTFNGEAFSAGAGCEANFYQGFGGNPPNNVFAVEFDSGGGGASYQEPLTVGGNFSYSSVQVYQSNQSTNTYVQSPCSPAINGETIYNKISTSPVPLTSPAGTNGTSTGDTYSANLVYNGTSLVVSLYDVTAGGSCPGSSCFTHTFTTDAAGNALNIPASVGGSNTAWLGIGGATNLASSYPLYIKGMEYIVGSPTQAPSAEGAPSFVGRAVGGGAYNASVAVPADIQDGDTIIAAVYSWAGYASPNESGWTSIDGNHDNANDYAELFQRVWHTGDPTTFIFYNAAYEKAVLRVYSGATEVDQHACAPIDNSNSASISALTISEVETYVGFWLNDSATITLPSDLDNPFSDWLQWFSADGDKVESTGAIPAEQATASQGDWVACGVTLTPTE
jgi:hypothetical protein